MPASNFLATSFVFLGVVNYFHCFVVLVVIISLLERFPTLSKASSANLILSSISLMNAVCFWRVVRPIPRSFLFEPLRLQGIRSCDHLEVPSDFTSTSPFSSCLAALLIAELVI